MARPEEQFDHERRQHQILSEDEERALLDLVESPGWAMVKRIGNDIISVATRDVMRRDVDQRDADYHRGAADRIRYLVDFFDTRAAQIRKKRAI